MLPDPPLPVTGFTQEEPGSSHPTACHPRCGKKHPGPIHPNAAERQAKKHPLNGGCRYWLGCEGSNLEPTESESVALPVELHPNVVASD